MKKNRIDHLLVYCFSILLALLLLVNLIVPARAFSPQENRYLQQMPKFTLDALFDGSFTADFEKYIQDQFFARDTWITVKTEMEKILGKKENNGVYFGKNGWYFEVKTTYNQEQLDKNIDYIQKFLDKTKANGIPTTFLPIYSSYTYYKEHMPPYAPNYAEEDIFAYLEKQLPTMQLLSNNLLKEHTKEALYFQTDHHWTQLGAYYAYVTLSEQLGFEPLPLDSFIQTTSPQPFFGTLYSKAPLAGHAGDAFTVLEQQNRSYSVYYEDTGETLDKLYQTENFTEKDQYVTFLGGNFSQVHISADNGTGRRLLLLKDSYSHALAPLLANHFDEIIMIDLRYFKKSLEEFMIEQEVTDVLLSYNLSWFADDTNVVNIIR